MATFTVTRVRKELSADRTHRHIEGVCVDGVHYSRRQVVDSINGGNTWNTNAGGLAATISTMRSCPYDRCSASPYIKTKPDSTRLDNLENLPEC